ncbi:hypothetical protein DFJ77DRAFT_538720 [Powellomyces hirtus]|nr:hypothetical protein DFJ77DRAFT_538720 [Powellomyces hirtus]
MATSAASPPAQQQLQQPHSSAELDDELFKSFINDDLLNMADMDLTSYNAQLADGADFDPLSYDMLLDETTFLVPPQLPSVAQDQMLAWTPMDGISSPESTTSNLRAFSPSSPSSAASVRSPTQEWLLDFEEPLQNTSIPSSVATTPPPVKPVVAAAPSPVTASLGSFPPPMPNGSSGQQWKFINCSATNMTTPSPPPPPPASVASRKLSIPVSQQRQQQQQQQQQQPIILEPLLQIKTESCETQPIPAVAKPPPPSIIAKATLAPAIAPAGALVPPPPPLSFVDIKQQPQPQQPEQPPVPLTSAQKRAERLIRNRAAALESRKRKREHQLKLEEQNEALQVENATLTARVQELEHKVVALQTENNSLRQKLYNACGQFADFETGLFAAKPLAVPAAAGNGGIVDLPNKKTVGTVLMTVFFSFALIFLPGFMTSTPHLGGHIVGKAFSSSQPYDEAGARLLDAPPQILYLPASAAAPSTAVGLYAGSSNGALVPSSHYVPVARRVESSISLPLDWRFGDVLNTLAKQQQQQHQARYHHMGARAPALSDGALQLAKLYNLFKSDDDTLDTKNNDEATTPVAAHSTLPSTTNTYTDTRSPAHQPRRGTVGKQLLHHTRDHPIPPGSVKQFLHVPPGHGIRYEADGSGAKTVPRLLTIDDAIHLMPYTPLAPDQPTPNTIPRPTTAAGKKSERERERTHGPRFSLVATIPAHHDRHARDEEQGGFLQLDVEVIDARLVRWNASGAPPAAAAAAAPAPRD